MACAMVFSFQFYFLMNEALVLLECLFFPGRLLLFLDVAAAVVVVVVVVVAVVVVVVACLGEVDP